jgi:hypothetical protein
VSRPALVHRGGARCVEPRRDTSLGRTRQSFLATTCCAASRLWLRPADDAVRDARMITDARRRRLDDGRLLATA